MSAQYADLLVVGAGAAGLTAALAAAGQGARVLIVTKGHRPDSASWLAQGGIAAALGDDDTTALHALDTAQAGREICRPSAVRVLTEEAPARLHELRALGVPFDPDLGLEGGHSRHRISHVEGAATGRAVTTALGRQVASTAGIEVREGVSVVALWRSEGRCVGVVTSQGPIAARATLLAMGGAAALWERTTNPPHNVGDGIALAYAAGVAVADLEFQQFHPTVLVGSRLLLSEALRGEGALLLDKTGNRFVDELAPRDVVARAVLMAGEAFLDLRGIDRSRFGPLMAEIERAGIDPARQPVPVSPAAHYTIGGVVTDLYGRTDLGGLFAAGECAATGVHGANRLASNSLLECLVFGRRAALAALDEPPLPDRLQAPPQPGPLRQVSPELRAQVWRQAGLLRDAEGLSELGHSSDIVASLVAQAALARTESRGVHYRVDYPSADPALEGHLVFRPEQAPALERWA
jgi:L-aspartate oxidase